MPRFLFTRNEVLRRTGTDADPKYFKDHVYELSGDQCNRWERRQAGRVVADNTPVGKFKSPEEREAEVAASRAAYWEGEGQTMTESKVALTNNQVRLNKLTTLVKATDELLEEAAADKAAAERAAKDASDRATANAKKEKEEAQQLGLEGRGAKK